MQICGKLLLSRKLRHFRGILTMFYTINLSPLLVINKGFMIIINLSNYQQCPLPLKYAHVPMRCSHNVQFSDCQQTSDVISAQNLKVKCYLCGTVHKTINSFYYNTEIIQHDLPLCSPLNCLFYALSKNGELCQTKTIIKNNTHTLQLSEGSLFGIQRDRCHQRS